MNTYDEKIFEYLKNHQNIMANKEYYQDLKETYRLAKKAFKENLYSDINVQNSEGDTFLHVAMRNVQDAEIENLLRLGADPSIKNAKKKNSFDVSSLHSIKEKYKNYSINYCFDISTKGFHDNFKNFVIRNQARSEFFSKKEFNQFIEHNPYITPATYIELLGSTHGLNNTQKIELFLEGNYTTQENSHFLGVISRKIYAKLNAQSLNAYVQLLEKDFSDNAHLHKAAQLILTPKSQLSLKSEKYKNSLMHLFMEKLLTSCDLQRTVKDTGKSLEKYLEDHVGSLYLSSKLNMTLQNHTQGKIMKI